MAQGKKRDSILFLTYLLGIASISVSVIQQILFLYTGELYLDVGGMANYFVIIASILIRFFLVDTEKFILRIRETDSSEDPSVLTAKEPRELKILSPNRFLNLMPLAMIVGTVASGVIHEYNVIGVIIFLVDQIILIVAYSGIIHFHPKALFSPEKKAKSVAIILSWAIIAILTYFTLIFPGEKFKAIGVVPYMISLVIMTAITYFGLFYKERSWKFRFSLCLGATFFLFSDTMIGYTHITNPGFYYSPIFIYPFWVLANFFLQFAVLFIGTEKGNPE